MCKFTWYWPFVMATVFTVANALLYCFIQRGVGWCVANYRRVSTEEGIEIGIKEEEEEGKVEEKKDKKMKILSKLLNRARDEEEEEEEKEKQLSR